MSNAPHDSSRQARHAEPREVNVNNDGGTRSIIGSTRGRLENWPNNRANEPRPLAGIVGLTPEEKVFVREVLGTNLAVARVVLVRHGDTGAKNAFEVKTASTNILPEEEKRAAEETAPSLLALGLDPKNTLLEFSGSATRARQTADALNKALNIPPENVCDWEVGGATTDKAIPNPHKAQAQQAVRAMDYAPALGWALRESAKAGSPMDAVVIAHQSTWAGFRSGAHNVKNTVFANDPEGFTPLETREFDVSVEPAGPLEYLNPDALGYVQITTSSIAGIVTTLKDKKILEDACARMQARLLRVTDFQNLLNATLIKNPALAKSLAGCGVPELDLMSLRAAMKTGYYKTTDEFDVHREGQIAALATMSLTKCGAVASASQILGTASAESYSTLLGGLQKQIKTDGWSTFFVTMGGLVEKGAPKEVAELFSAIQALALAENVFGRSPDYRVSGKSFPIGTQDREFDRKPHRFHVVIKDKNGGRSSAILAQDALGDIVRNRGLTVIEADAGYGKSLFSAEMVQSWLNLGRRVGNESLRLAYVDLHGKKIHRHEEDGRNFRTKLEKIASESDVMILDSLDEADWRTVDESSNDKKIPLAVLRHDISDFLLRLPERMSKGQGNIIVTSRPGHMTTVGIRQWRLAALEADETHEFVRDYFSGQPDLVVMWERATRSNKTLVETARHPLTLALVCEAASAGKVYTGGDWKICIDPFEELTDDVTLYETVLRLRIEKWENATHKSSEGPLKAKKRAEIFMDALGWFAFNKKGGSFDRGPIPAAYAECVEEIRATHGTPLLDPLSTITGNSLSSLGIFTQEKIREYLDLRHLRRIIGVSDLNNLHAEDIIEQLNFHEWNFKTLKKIPAEDREGFINKLNVTFELKTKITEANFDQVTLGNLLDWAIGDTARKNYPLLEKVSEPGTFRVPAWLTRAMLSDDIWLLQATLTGSFEQACAVLVNAIHWLENGEDKCQPLSLNNHHFDWCLADSFPKLLLTLANIGMWKAVLVGMEQVSSATYNDDTRNLYEAISKTTDPEGVFLVALEVYNQIESEHFPNVIEACDKAGLSKQRMLDIATDRIKQADPLLPVQKSSLYVLAKLGDPEVTLNLLPTTGITDFVLAQLLVAVAHNGKPQSAFENATQRITSGRQLATVLAAVVRSGFAKSTYLAIEALAKILGRDTEIVLDALARANMPAEALKMAVVMHDQLDQYAFARLSRTAHCMGVSKEDIETIGEPIPNRKRFA